MVQTEKVRGRSALVEATPGDLTTTQTVTNLPWSHTRWTIAGTFVDADGVVAVDGALPTSGLLTFRVKTRANRQWETFSSNEVDLAEGATSVTVAGHIESVEMVLDALSGAAGGTQIKLTAIGTTEGAN